MVMQPSGRKCEKPRADRLAGGRRRGSLAIAFLWADNAADMQDRVLTTQVRQNKKPRKPTLGINCGALMPAFRDSLIAIRRAFLTLD